MGIFSGLFRSRDKPQDRTAGSGYAFYFGGTTSGKAVTERSAMQMTAVYSCVRILAEAVAGLPLHLYRYKEDGGKEKAIDHPLYLLLHDEPNPEMSSFVFRETLMTHLLLWGNAYAQIIRNGKGEVIALYPLMPDRMTVNRDSKGQLYYEYTVSMDDAPTIKGSLVRLNPSDVLHIPGLGFDGLVGYSPIAMAKNAIGMAIACEEYGAKFFANGAAPGGVLEHPGTIKDPQRVRESWQSTFGGSGNANKIAVLEEGMKYTPYDHFHRNLKRHLRFRYPTYIFDDISFEIDEEGTPYWICSVADYKIGLFGGKTIGRVVLCNAVTGECTDYAVKDVPSWVDRVYSADLLVQLYDYYGSLKHGFINSVLGQKDCLTTTNGYNYLAMNDDVWVYTGVTSITSDQSNVGFVLMNERTMETKYYQVEGAIEDSAMSSAEGKVQNLGYTATFPLLLNITNEPTYFIALKDDSGLVKMYAMVNVQKYQIVATGDSVSECEKNYMELMKQNGVNAETKESDSVKKATGTIAKITDAVVEGNTHQYILLENDSDIYDVSVVDYLDIVRYGVGDTITFEYMEGEQANTVLGIEK